VELIRLEVELGRYILVPFTQQLQYPAAGEELGWVKRVDLNF
jgi:hypothetical protein